ncbi:MAG: XdhC family protein [Gemmatimonadota bacterium]
MMETGPLSPAQAAAHLLSAMEAGEKAAVLVVIAHPDQARVGGRVLLRGAERLGSFRDPVADAAGVELAREGLTGNTKVLPGLHTLPLANGDHAKVYLELHHPPSEMVIVGAGHLAQPLCTLGALLGLRVRVLDDRPEFATRERFPEAHEVRRVDFSDPFAGGRLHLWSHVLLVTRGHRYDFECLRKVLQHEPLPGYIGMIGSRRRVRATFNALLQEGFSPDLLSQVRAPIGLDIGGETPAEIAVSVAAEIVQLWRGGSGSPLRDAERVLERFSLAREKDPTDTLGGKDTP